MNPLKDILDFIFPRQCLLCGNTLSDKERYVCAPCLAGIPRTLYHRKHNNPMEHRFAGLFPFDKASGHFFYSSGADISKLIQDLKYRHFQGLARYLGEVVAQELLLSDFFNNADAIIPIPIHFFKKAKRGYNQTEQIAIGISKITGIPVLTNLCASRPHRTQTSLTLAQRRQNTHDIFVLKKPDVVNYKKIILLDDVCTTGSTLTSAAEAILKDAPNASISLLTIGVTF